MYSSFLLFRNIILYSHKTCGVLFKLDCLLQINVLSCLWLFIESFYSSQCPPPPRFIASYILLYIHCCINFCDFGTILRCADCNLFSGSCLAFLFFLFVQMLLGIFKPSDDWMCLLFKCARHCPA